MKILIVDDDPIFLELIEKYLADIGNEDVHSVESAKAALEAIDALATPFDCCLLDINMPGMSGIELCREIRARKGYASTPIVMITSMTEKSFVDQAFQAGANDYVTKPIDRIEIAARMGMVRALVDERANAQLHRRHISKREDAEHSKLQFRDPIALEDAGGTIPLASMEAYLLRLGNLRLFSSAAVGIHIENADVIFAKTGGLEFADLLSEVALAILDNIEDSDALLSYAGSGDFCCVRPRLKLGNVQQMEEGINDRIEQRLGLLCSNDDVPLPHVRVGQPCTNGVLSFNDPTFLIYRSLDEARTSSHGRASLWSKAEAEK